MIDNSFKKIVTPALLSLSLFSFNTLATIVEFQTSHGNFRVNLHDETTPKTVENFLKYVTDGDYNNTIVHRVEPEFVVQAGGYYFDGELPIKAIDTDGTVINEPVYSNVRGTIAMAKVAGNENSATSQWFVNLNDNSAGSPQLDTQNGGFTVFGEVISDEDGSNGMATLDAIAELSLCSSIPMPDYSAENCSNSITPGFENFVTIDEVIIYDDAPNTAASLASVKNTLNSQPPTPTQPTEKSSSGGGGSIAWYSLLMIASLSLFRTKK